MTASVSLTMDLPAAEAARRLLLVQLEKIRDLMQAILNRDPDQTIDAVHDLRVTLRRAMTLLDNFAPWLDAGWISRYQKGCRKILRLLGVIRDLDVLGERAGSLAPADGEDLACLQERLAADRRRMHRRLTGILAGKELQRWLARRIDGLASPGSVPPADADREGEQTCLLRDCLPAILYLAASRLTAFRDFDRDGDRALHQLRIAAKGFRYTVEAFEPLLGEPARLLTAEFKDFQDLLGKWHDDRVALGYLDEFMAGRQASETVKAWQAAWENELAGLQADFRQRWPHMQTAWFHGRLSACLDAAYGD